MSANIGRVRNAIFRELFGDIGCRLFFFKTQFRMGMQMAAKMSRLANAASFACVARR